jgi:hypothetical protein
MAAPGKPPRMAGVLGPNCDCGKYGVSNTCGACAYDPTKVLNLTHQLISAAMKYRKLRIAWSVACGIICLLLIVLWVRSYWQAHLLSYWEGATPRWAFGSERGIVGFRRESSGIKPLNLEGLRFYSFRPDHNQPMPGFLGFGYIHSPNNETRAIVPIWSIALAAIAFVAAPWLRWRFSLRTLLIGITVAAAILGAVICAVT